MRQEKPIEVLAYRQPPTARETRDARTTCTSTFGLGACAAAGAWVAGTLTAAVEVFLLKGADATIGRVESLKNELLGVGLTAALAAIQVVFVRETDALAGRRHELASPPAAALSGALIAVILIGPVT